MSLYINGQAVSPIEKSKHAYSTTEQEIGTWVDGKTLYEKSYVFTAEQVASGTMQTGLNPSEIDTIMFDLSSSYIQTLDNAASGGHTIIKSISYWDSMNNQGMRIERSSESIVIGFFKASSINSPHGNSVITLRYTKNS